MLPNLLKGVDEQTIFDLDEQEEPPGSDTARIDRLEALSSFSVWCCMAVFSVDGVICLVTSFHKRVLGLLNHVKYDLYFP